jgi:hypothetical protein
MGAIAQIFSGSSSSSTSPQQMLQEEQAQFNANFALETQASMNQNTNQTYTAIGTNENTDLAASQAGETQVGQANAKIVA